MTASHSLSHRANFAPTTTLTGRTVSFLSIYGSCSFKVITLCERLAGQDANVTTVPVSVLRVTRQVTRLFEWTSDVADRLAFSEVKFFLFSFPEILDLLVLFSVDETSRIHCLTCSNYF